MDCSTCGSYELYKMVVSGKPYHYAGDISCLTCSRFSYKQDNHTLAPQQFNDPSQTEEHSKKQGTFNSAYATALEVIDKYSNGVSLTASMMGFREYCKQRLNAEHCAQPPDVVGNWP